MKPFELVQPDSLDAASEHAGPNALIKAAGIDVLDRLKERLEEPDQIINLLDLRKELSGISPNVYEDGTHIGALTTLAQIAGSEMLTSPALGAVQQAAAKTATPQVRNRATAGGNLLQLTRCWYRRSAHLGCAHGGDGPDCLAQNGENRYHAIMGGIDCFRVHPSNLAPALIAVDAKVIARNKDGESRRLSLLELYPEEPYADEAEHTLAEGEILTGIHIPTQPKGTRSAYRDSREKDSFDWPTTAAAVRLSLDGGTMGNARICLGAVSPIPVFSPEAAEMLNGQKPSAELFAKVAAKAYEGAEPLEHNAYKIEIGQATLRDALAAAAEVN